jgi:peptidoglycan/LPS O-acetylase OafA/YrhL
MNEKLKRISFLDGLRGVAILSVVLFHAYARYPQIVPYGNEYSEIVFFKYGRLGVHLFFMISGFVILMTLEKTTNFFQFMYRRWLRLFPAMLIVSILVFATARMLFPERPQGIPVLRDLLPGLTFIDNDALTRIFHSHQGVIENAFWSLFVEAKFYVIFGLIFFIFGVNAAIAGLVALFVCYVLNAPFVWRFSPEYMGWFASGAMYYLYFKGGRKNWLWMAVLMSLASAASLPKGADSILAGVVMSLFFMAVMLSERLRLIISSKFLLFLGFVSYPLYLVHENMLVSCIVKFGHWMPFMPNFLIPVIPIAIVVTIGWFVATYAEPGLRGILRGILERNKIAKPADPQEKLVLQEAQVNYRGVQCNDPNVKRID